MKNFTFFLVMFLITLGLSAQNISEFRKRIQQKQEKITQMTQREAKLNNFLRFSGSASVLKSAMATQKLDSTVDRVLNAGTQLWQNDTKSEYIYDAQMKSTSWIEKEWDLAKKTWIDLSKTDFGYDAQKRINSMLMYDRDSLTQKLILKSKTLTFYNSGGMQDSSLTYSTKTSGKTWILDIKNEYHYNASKKLIKTDMWSLDDLGVLILDMNIVYTYTASGKIKTSTTNIVDGADEMPLTKIEYFYDGADRLTSREYSRLNFFTFAFEKSTRDSYQYNASGKVTVEINSTWNGTAWVNKDKYESTFNAAGDESVYITSTWNGTSWVQTEKDENTYSTTNFSEVAFPAIFYLYGVNEADFALNKAITLINSFEMINASWKNTGKTTFYYSGGTSTNITEFENSVVNVYPNPASESVNFSWKGNDEALSLQIYQITGAKVIEQTVYSGKPVSISQLENGVYLYKLLNGQQNVKTGKMIKR